MYKIQIINILISQEYVGCFADSAQRDLPFIAYSDPLLNNNIEKCAAMCARYGYKYAGLQYAYDSCQ